MALIPEPIFFPRIVKNQGARRKLIHINNTSNEEVAVNILDIEKPEWVDLEEVARGRKLTFGKARKTPVVVNINSDHIYFPSQSSMDEKVSLKFDNDLTLDIPITIQEIVEEELQFHGVFAMDFGTSNTCYAYKNKFDPGADPEEAFKPAKSSGEIPTLVFFKDVSNRAKPKYQIGTDALYEIKDHAGQTYSYFMSIKRLLGTEKKFIVMDDHSGLHPDNRQEWGVEDIAAFIVKDIIRQAEKEARGKISQVVATYPTLFSQAKKNALRRVFQKAFDILGYPFDETSLVLNLDEANGAAFNYIYGPMLDDFRNFDKKESKTYLLSYDFGGGTIDISLIKVEITRDEEGRIAISNDLKGVSGESYYGGDNVTLEVFKLLKTKLALEVARSRHKEEEAPKPVEEAKADDLWGGGKTGKAEDLWGGSGATAADDPWGAPKPKEEPKVEAAPVDSLDDVDIENKEDQKIYQETINRVYAEADAIEKAIEQGLDLYQVIEAKCQEQKKPFDRRNVDRLLKSIEQILPTRWAEYEDKDPFKEDAAKKLFYELWHEAEVMKILLVTSPDGVAPISNPLKRIAKYTGVDPKNFNEKVKLAIGELNRSIQPRIERSIKKAYNLFQSALNEAAGGIVVRGGASAQRPELRILLAGNSSQLPIVRQTFLETFQVDESNIIFKKGRLKTSVAQGACEEWSLRKEFGEHGLINYRSTDFLERLPYALGLYHKDLSMVGYKNGFCPIFGRGANEGEEMVLDEKTNFLVHSKMTDLAVYADYSDGQGPVYVGWFNFRTPLPEIDEAIATEGASNEDGVFRIKLKLLPNRDLLAVNLKTGQQYKFSPIEDKVKPEDNPFSGIH